MRRNNLNAFKPSFYLILAASTFLPFMNCSQNFEAQNVLMRASDLSSSSLATSVLIINEPAAAFATQDKLTLKGNCSSGVRIDVSGDVKTPVSATCTSNLFSIEVTLSDGDGAKNIRVAQVDYMGNAKVDSRSFMKDTAAPQVDLTGVVDASFIGNNFTFSGICESGIPVNIQVGSVSQTVSCLKGMFSTTLNLSGVGDGTTTLSVSQTDGVGLRTLKTRTLMKDGSAPRVTLVSPINGASITSPVAINGTCETGINVVVAGAGVATSLTLPCLSAAFSGVVNLTAGTGAKAITVTQIDAVGNTGSDSKTFQAMAPTGTVIPVAILAPAANAAAKDGLTLTGTCRAGLAVAVSGNGVSAASNVNCVAGGTFSAPVVFSAGDGVKVVSVKQTDSAGNSGQDTRSFFRDTLVPTLTLAQPASGTAAKSALTLSGACESGLNISVTGAIVTLAPVACNSGSFSVAVTFSSGDGTKSITLTQADAAGNVATLTRNFIRDNVAPSVTITSPADGATAATEVSLQGACETGLNVIAAGAGAKATVTKMCASSAYSMAVVLSDADGTKVISVSQTDGAGNVGSVQRTFNRVTPPVVYDGVALYTTNCAGCHSALGSSTKRDRTATQITAAIGTVPLMQGLSVLNAAQVTAIALALKTPVVTPDPTPETPVTLPPNTNLACVSGSDPAIFKTRRLTKREYINTLISLFRYGDIISWSNRVNEDYRVVGGVSTLVGAVPEDDQKKKFSRLDGVLSATMLEGQFIMAQAIAKEATKSGVLRYYAGDCATIASPTTVCVNDFITSFGKKVYRRPLKTEEVNDLKAIYDQFMVTSATDGFQAVFEAMLLSPQFLMLLEAEGAVQSDKQNLLKLTDYELASRISYALTENMPSDDLMAAADAGKLTSSDASLKAEVVKIVNSSILPFTDPYYINRTHPAMMSGFQKTMMRFYEEWIGLDKIQYPGNTGPVFDTFVNIYGNSRYVWTDFDGGSRWGTILQEPRDFMFRLTFDENKKYADLLTNNTTVMMSTDSSVTHYYLTPAAMPLQTPTAFSDRTGILTRASFLTSGTEATHPILRGAFIRRNLLCDQLPSPDPDKLPDRSLAPPEENPNLTARERFAAKTAAPECMSCHSQINSLGFALEDFDAIGRNRKNLFEPVFKLDGTTVTVLSRLTPNAKVDSVNFTPNDGISVNGGIELSQALASSEKANTCFVRQVYRYTTAKIEGTADDCIMKSMYDEMNKSGGGILDLIKAMVTHPHFKLKNRGT